MTHVPGHVAGAPALADDGTYPQGGQQSQAFIPGNIVYLGPKEATRSVSSRGGRDELRAGKFYQQKGYKNITGNVDSVKDEYASKIYKDPKYLAEQINYMRSLGYKINSTSQLQRFYNAAVDYSAKMYAMNTFITPEEALGFKSPFGSGSGRGGSGGGGGGTSTQIQRSVNISSAKDAKALINQSFQQSVGRDATDDEIKQFRSALNAEEKKNPSITKTTQTVSGSNVSTTNETTGGMDRGAYMLEQGQKAEDYAEFQTETTYMDALMSAISGGV